MRTSFAQQKTETKFMAITIIESTSQMVGKSTMIITKDSTQEEIPLNIISNWITLNYKNIKANESQLVQTLNTYASQGWKLLVTLPADLNNHSKSSDILITRYLLTKEVEVSKQ